MRKRKQRRIRRTWKFLEGIEKLYWDQNLEEDSRFRFVQISVTKLSKMAKIFTYREVLDYYSFENLSRTRKRPKDIFAYVERFQSGVSGRSHGQTSTKRQASNGMSGWLGEDYGGAN